MTGPRWTDQTAEIVLEAINECDLGDDYATAILTALADAGLLVEPGGETRLIYRCYDLVSGGAYQTSSLKSVEDHCRASRSHERDPLGPAPNPRQHQQADETTWPDGTVHVGPWVEVPS